MTHIRHIRWPARLTVAAAIAAGTLTAVPAAAEGEVLGAGVPNAIKDSYVVELGASTARGAVPSLAASLAGRYDATVTHTYQHAVRGFAATLSEADARKLAADPAVARVQQNVAGTIDATQFNPPSYGLDRIDQRVRPMLGSYTYPNAGSGVSAYVIDSGIRITHGDFGGRAFFGVNTIDNINTDCFGHGTHVAGTIGGAAYGVAKGVALIAVKVGNCAGGLNLATVVAGVDWVTAHHVAGPAVANMSLGFAGAQPILENAVRRSIADGIVYAISSGNSSTDACGFSPARVAEAVTVNASDGGDVRAAFSNLGGCTDIFAPGVNIVSAGIASDVAGAVMSGTSMAAPHVAGASALVLAANPALAPQQVADTLYANATVGLVANAPNTPNRLLFVGHHAPPAPAAGPDHLVRGQYLLPNQFIRSPNQRCTLYMQGDGNLVIYLDMAVPLWNTGTAGRPGSFAVFQPDGNFVLHVAAGAPKHTATYGTAATQVRIQDDCNLVVYGDSNQVYWHRGLPLF